MNRYKGKAAFRGIAMGIIHELDKKETVVRRVRVKESDAEIQRFLRAKEVAVLQLQDLYDKALRDAGKTSAAIFEVHQMMLDDDDFLGAIKNIIRVQEVNAEFAVAETSDDFAEMFAEMDDEYMQARAADVRDVSGRLLKVLAGEEDVVSELKDPCIIVADDLTPTETVLLDKSKVLAFVTRQGSVNSHTAILARTMNIPAIVSADVPRNIDRTIGIADGGKGVLIVNPDEDAKESYRVKRAELDKTQELLQELKGKQTITKSGREVFLYANIGGIEDIGAALHNDAEGVGLFRSEFLYLEKNEYPTEEEQFQVYRKAARMMAGKKVVIRTLDIGADKKIDYFDLPEEENPALGYRAVRICLTREALFKTQLRALYRASAYGTIAVMVPMIVSVWEVKAVKRIIAEVKEELQELGIVIGEVEFGIMIETPAAALISDELAKEVDFFSIGTNDLTQYTLAIDRQNPSLDMFYDAHHPAILKMIKMVVDSAHKEKIWVGICGELAADLELTDTFVEMGVDELSVSPAMVLPVRKKIREYD